MHFCIFIALLYFHCTGLRINKNGDDQPGPQPGLSGGALQVSKEAVLHLQLAKAAGLQQPRCLDGAFLLNVSVNFQSTHTDRRAEQLCQAVPRVSRQI